MNLFDSHCHLNDEAFGEDIAEVLARAKTSGLTRILCLGYDIPSSKKAIELASKYDIVYAAVGFHPENLEGYTLEDIREIEKLAHSPKVIAIGEVGLDYHYEKKEETGEKQRAFLIAQIELANRLNLPLSIHARDAAEDMYEVLSANPPRFGAVLHCYSGSVEMMKRFSKLDLYFGFDGPITYKNAVVPKECVAACPSDRLLIETDSPYLSPVPLRGKRNEPANVVHIFDMARSLRGIEAEEMEKQLNENFERLFHVK